MKNLSLRGCKLIDLLSILLFFLLCSPLSVMPFFPYTSVGPPLQGRPVVLHSLMAVWVGNPSGRLHSTVWPNGPKGEVADPSQSRLDGQIPADHNLEKCRNKESNITRKGF